MTVSPLSVPEVARLSVEITGDLRDEIRRHATVA